MNDEDNRKRKLYLLIVVALLIAFLAFSLAQNAQNTADINNVFEMVVNNTNLAPAVVDHPGTGERVTGTTYYANNSPIQLMVFAHANVVAQTAAVAVYINDTLVVPQSGRPLGGAEDSNRSAVVIVPKFSSYRVNFTNAHHYEWREYPILSGRNGTLSINQTINGSSFNATYDNTTKAFNSNYTAQTFPNSSIGNASNLTIGTVAEARLHNMRRSFIGYNWTIANSNNTVLAGQIENRVLLSLGGCTALIGGGLSAQVGRTTDCGRSWYPVYRVSGEQYVYTLTSFGNGVIIGGTAPNAHIIRSTDWGRTWTDLGNVLVGETRIRVTLNLGNGTAIAGTYPNAKMVRSTDYGATWAPVNGGASLSPGDLYLFSGAYLGRCIAVVGTGEGVGGNITRTTDCGVTWNKVNSGNPIVSGQIYIYRLEDFGDGVVIGTTGNTNGHILRSLDYGATWTDLGVGKTGAQYLTALRNLGNGVGIVGTYPDARILRTDNYFDTWIDVGNVTNGEDHIYDFAQFDNGIIIGAQSQNGKLIQSDEAKDTEYGYDVAKSANGYNTPIGWTENSIPYVFNASFGYSSIFNYSQTNKLGTTGDSTQGSGENIGNAFVGSWASSAGYAVFSHNAFRSSPASDDKYAFIEDASGNTFFNSNSTIRFLIKGVTKMRIENDTSGAGLHDGYACFNATGYIYRSQNPCV